MSLEMKVYRDPLRYEAKAMFGLTWRQLGALAMAIPIAGGLYALAVWLLIEHRGATFEEATNAAMVLLVALFLPFAVWGWYRPHGLKPERWLPYVLDYYLHPKELCRGYDEKPVGRRLARHRRRDADEERAGARPDQDARPRGRQARPSEHVAHSEGRMVPRWRR